MNDNDLSGLIEAANAAWDEHRKDDPDDVVTRTTFQIAFVKGATWQMGGGRP